MKILIDMNLSPRWAKVLQQEGLEADHWSSIGLASSPDTEIMAHALQHNMVVLTNDLDFGIMLAISRAERPSVLQIRHGNLRPENLETRVIEAFQKLSEPLEQGALISVDPRRTRLRVLPLM